MTSPAKTVKFFIFAGLTCWTFCCQPPPDLDLSEYLITTAEPDWQLQLDYFERNPADSIPWQRPIVVVDELGEEKAVEKLDELLLKCKNLVNEAAGSTSKVTFAATADGDAALIQVAGLGLTSDALLLIECGARVNAQRSSDKSTALLVAIRGQHDDVVQMLLDNGADFNLADNKGNTPLIDAVTANSVRMTSMLLEFGDLLKIDAVNSQGYTALITAAERGDTTDLVERLITAKAGLNVRNNVGQTAVYAAAKNGHCDVVLLLAKAGANVDITDKAGLSPLAISAKIKSTSCVRSLRLVGASTAGCKYILCSGVF